MTKASDAEIVREVSERIDVALRENRRDELNVIGLLVSMFLAGLLLLGVGAWFQRMSILVPGGLLELLLVLPVRWLIRLREANMRWRILPQLLRLATTKEAKILAARLVAKLIEQV